MTDHRNVDAPMPEAWPFYVVADVSKSMWFKPNNSNDYTPWDVINDGLTGIIDEIDFWPTSRDICHLSIIAFGERVVTMLPLTGFNDNTLTFGTPPKLGYTDFTTLFAHLSEVVATDYRRLSTQYRLKSPAVYFITDGYAQDENGAQPDSAWVPHVNKLHQLPEKPIVVSLGLGQAKESALRTIANAPGPACIAKDGALPSDLLKSIIENIILSVTHSTSAGAFVFDVPAGMRAL